LTYILIIITVHEACSKRYWTF